MTGIHLNDGQDEVGACCYFLITRHAGNQQHKKSALCAHNSELGQCVAVRCHKNVALYLHEVCRSMMECWIPQLRATCSSTITAVTSQ